MTTEQQESFKVIIEKDQVICRDGDKSYDLFKVLEGELMICKRNNHMVTPIAYLKEGDYFGEMSFFDKIERSADVIATERSVLFKIPQEELKKQFPQWLNTFAKGMTKRLRSLNNAISKKGIKRQNQEVKPLSIDEQRRIYALLTE